MRRSRSPRRTTGRSGRSATPAGRPSASGRRRGSRRSGSGIGSGCSAKPTGRTGGLPLKAEAREPLAQFPGSDARTLPQLEASVKCKVRQAHGAGWG
jgi:hypothetical protein